MFKILIVVFFILAVVFGFLSWHILRKDEDEDYEFDLEYMKDMTKGKYYD